MAMLVLAMTYTRLFGYKRTSLLTVSEDNMNIPTPKRNKNIKRKRKLITGWTRNDNTSGNWRKKTTPVNLKQASFKLARNRLLEWLRNKWPFRTSLFPLSVKKKIFLRESHALMFYFFFFKAAWWTTVYAHSEPIQNTFTSISFFLWHSVQRNTGEFHWTV